MLTTKRKPAGIGEILVEEFLQPLGLTQGALAAAMGVQRKHVNELCNGKRGSRHRLHSSSPGYLAIPRTSG